jgi:sugar fermentation stimulation protein A
MNLPPLVAGRLVVRRNRFVAEVVLDDGGSVLAHCPNTGSMLGCQTPGSRVWLSHADNPLRKLAWTWELVEAGGALVGLHTGRANALVREAIVAGRVPALAGYPTLRGEVAYGENSRIDLLLEAAGRPPCYVEVKSVTAAADGGHGFFPDAVTARGAKHLREMANLVAQGRRAVLVFCVQRQGVRSVAPAEDIDPAYAQGLRAAVAAGVEVLALAGTIRLATDGQPASIVLGEALPVHLRGGTGLSSTSAHPLPRGKGA